MSSGPTRLLLYKITVNHNGSPPFFDRMPLVYEYNTMPDIVTAVGLSDDTKNKLRTEADQRLTYPGSRPPGRTASTAAARLSRLNATLCVSVVVLGRNRTNHTPHRAGPPDRDPGLEMRGADARGPIVGLPRVLHGPRQPRSRPSVHSTSRGTNCQIPVDALDGQMGNQESTGIGHT
jgi:hypothetical protein